MKERPIIFSAPMVRALLDGKKTQTRRAVKPQPTPATRFNTNLPLQAGDWVWPYPNSSAQRVTNLPTGPEGWSKHCPYGQPGDRLWVRERHHRTTDGGPILIGYDVPGENREYEVPGLGRVREFRSHLGGWGGRSSRNFPSIHMPRWASRITLELTDVRVQRLQGISHDDAAAEGCPGVRSLDPALGLKITPREQYQRLWESINGAGSWNANPWTWAITFRRLP